MARKLNSPLKPPADGNGSQAAATVPPGEINLDAPGPADPVMVGGERLPQLPPANGNGSSSDDYPPDADEVMDAAEHATEESPAKVLRYKAPSQVFYLLTGTTKDGECVDVLGIYPTGNQARKSLKVMVMAVKRNYTAVRVLQCRDRTDG